MSKLDIYSENIFVSSSLGNVDVRSNDQVSLGSKKEFIINVGPVDNSNNNEPFFLNSKNITLGYKPSFSVQKEPIVKADTLIEKMNKTLDIMSGIASNPYSAAMFIQQIQLLKTELEEIKSKTTSTY